MFYTKLLEISYLQHLTLHSCLILAVSAWSQDRTNASIHDFTNFFKRALNYGITLTGFRQTLGYNSESNNLKRGAKDDKSYMESPVFGIAFA